MWVQAWVAKSPKLESLPGLPFRPIVGLRLPSQTLPLHDFQFTVHLVGYQPGPAVRVSASIQQVRIPPSTTKFAPVTQLDSSDARNSADHAMSSGVPKR